MSTSRCCLHLALKRQSFSVTPFSPNVQMPVYQRSNRSPRICQGPSVKGKRRVWKEQRWWLISWRTRWPKVSSGARACKPVGYAQPYLSGIEFGLITDSHLSRPTGMTGTAKRPNSKLFNRSLPTATMVTIMMTTMLWSMTLHPSRISGNRNPHMSRKTWLPMTTLAMTRMKRSLETGMDDCSIVQGK